MIVPRYDHQLRAFDRWVGRAERLMTDAQVWRAFSRATAGFDVALCLHHVSSRRRDWLTIAAGELDLFLCRALMSRGAGAARWLTVSFDDGYADACEYVRTRASRFPEIEWIFFACPEKLQRRVGFRSDLELARGLDDDPTPAVVCGENQRADLRWVAQFERNALATIEQCREIAQLPNVRLGNHSNCHFRPISVPLGELAREYAQSFEDFAHLFGPACDFAFPFGGPGVDFDERHVELVRGAGDCLIWSTERRPSLPSERRSGALLPRFAARGAWSAQRIALWIACLSLRTRHARGVDRSLPSS